MKVKSVHLEDEFIPEYNGNKDLPKADQIIVKIKDHISNLQFAMYKKFINKDDGGMVIEYDDTNIMVRHVGEILNLEDGDSKIKDGIELADSKNKLLYPLMVEIRNHLLNDSEILTEGES